MNRRGFLGLMAGAMLATASVTRLAETVLACPLSYEEMGQRYARHLALSMAKTRETIAANILNKVFS